MKTLFEQHPYFIQRRSRASGCRRPCSSRAWSESRAGTLPSFLGGLGDASTAAGWCISACWCPTLTADAFSFLSSFVSIIFRFYHFRFYHFRFLSFSFLSFSILSFSIFIICVFIVFDFYRFRFSFFHAYYYPAFVHTPSSFFPKRAESVIDVNMNSVFRSWFSMLVFLVWTAPPPNPARTPSMRAPWRSLWNTCSIPDRRPHSLLQHYLQ